MEERLLLEPKKIRGSMPSPILPLGLVAVAQGRGGRGGGRSWWPCSRHWRRSWARGPYFGGDALGFVDVALVPFAPYERFGGFSVAAECPALAAWAARCATENSCVAAGRRERVPVRVWHEEALRPGLALTQHVVGLI
jgi:hypothetical protein